MTHKLSDWQAGDTIPELDGVYQRRKVNVFSAFYALFKNGEWKVGRETQEAAKNENAVSMFQDWKWRGIK